MDLPPEPPNPELILSAAPEQRPAYADALAAAARGELTARHIRDLALEVAGESPYTERDPAIITEAELRLLDGNR